MKRAVSMLWFVTLSFLGCAQPADILNPHAYDDSGLSFNYPGNWRVKISDEEGGIRSIDVESDQSAMTFIIDMPSDIAMSADEFESSFLRGYSKSLETEGGSLTIEQTVRVEASIDGQVRVGKKSRINVKTQENQEIFHQIMYIYPHEWGMTGIIFQVADHDLPDTIEGFDLIISTIHKNFEMESI